MPITLELAGMTADNAVVQPSPLLELMAAMHVLTERDHHPEQHRVAVQLQHALGEEVMELTHRYSPLWSRLRCRLFFVRGEGPGIDAQFAALEALPAERFTELAAEGVLGLGRKGDHVALFADPAAFIEACRRRSSARAELAQRLVDDAGTFRAELLDFLRRAWTAGVRDRWQASAPLLTTATERIRTRLRADLVHTVAALSPTATVTDARVRFDKLDTVTFEAAAAPLVLVPSVLHAPHLTVKRAPAGELVVLFAASAAQGELSLEQLHRRLQSLGSPLRMELLRHLLGEPLTSAELSLRLGVEATQVSRALSQLRATGMVVSERDGGTLRHRADIEAIRRLGLDVLATIMR